jgi:hypothetical protein
VRCRRSQAAAAIPPRASLRFISGRSAATSPFEPDRVLAKPPAPLIRVSLRDLHEVLESEALGHVGHILRNGAVRLITVVKWQLVEHSRDLEHALNLRWPRNQPQLAAVLLAEIEG